MRITAQSIIRSCLVFLTFAVAWQSAYALDTSFTNSYTGNFNGGAVDSLYHGGSKFTLIPIDDITIPIKTGEPNYLFAVIDGDAATEWTYSLGYLGLGDLSRDSYRLHIGDFNGDGRDDLFFQARSASLQHHIIYAHGAPIQNQYPGFGPFDDIPEDGYTVPPYVKSWSDGYLGIQWSSASIIINDFNGDGKADFQITSSANSTAQISGNISYTTTAATVRNITTDIAGNLYIANTETSYSDGTINYNENDLAVGNTSGGFSVAPGGSASYSMSIPVPPGIGEMQPSLGISVSSTGGNGIMGIGGSLNGLSSIHRCPQTHAQDGANRGIKFDATDRLCMDGQRLVVVSGTYGAVNSVYRTEQDSFSRIRLKGGDLAGGNSWFEVETKAGQIFYYGADDAGGGNIRGSRVYLTTNQTGAAMGWSIGRMVDASDVNIIDYHYAGNGLNDHRLSQITYTSVAGTSAAVVFNYENRDDTGFAYVGGQRISKTLRLKQITTQESGTTVRSYNLLYQYSASSNHSRLKYLFECGDNEAAANNCKRPVEFTWQDDSSTPLSGSHIRPIPNGTTLGLCENIPGGQTTGTGCRQINDRNNIMYGDVDGDGYTDVCYRTDEGVKCAFGSTSGPDISTFTSYSVCQTGSGCSEDTLALMDINGDGRADLIYRHYDNGITVAFSTGANRGFTGPQSSNLLSKQAEILHQDLVVPSPKRSLVKGDYADVFYPDLNGDGRTDFCVLPVSFKDTSTGDEYHENLQCYVNNNTGSNFSSFTQFNVTLNCPDGCDSDSFQMLDINADGNADVVYRDTNQGMIYALNSGASIGPKTATNICSYGDTTHGCNDSDNFSSIEFADVTGDGLPDMCYRSDAGIQCIPGKGSNFDTANIIKTPLCGNGVEYGCDASSISFPDINGDGKADISLVKHGEGIKMYLSTGSSFEYLGEHATCSILTGSISTTYQCDSTEDNYHTVRYVDLNGDGQNDLAFRGDNGMHFFLSNTAAAKAPDMLTGITDGLKNTTTINYARLNDSAAGVYSIDTCTNNYPEACVNGPMYVVSSYSASNGVGGTASYSYQYADLKSHLRGRGILGFGKLVHIDANNGTKVTTTTFNLTGISTGTDSFVDLYPYAGMPASNTTTVNGQNIQTVTNNIDAYGTLTTDASIAAPYFVYFTNSTESNYHYIDAATTSTLVTTVFTENRFDKDTGGVYLAADQRHGNLTHNVTTTTDVVTGETFTKTTDSTYTDNESLWHLGRVTMTRVKHSTTSTGLGSTVIPDIERVSEFEYDASKGWLTKSIEERNDPQYELTTTYTYDTYGNKLVVVKSGPATATHKVDARKAESYYSNSAGVKQTTPSIYLTTENDLGQKEIKTVDPRTGNVTVLVGPNGLATTWNYDHLGRKLAEYRADGTNSQTSLFWCNGCSPEAPNAVYRIESSATGNSAVTAYYDSLDREVLVQAADINGNTIYTRTTYDALGRKVSVTLPYFNNETPILAQDLTAADAFDDLGRVKKAVDANGNIVENTYNGLTISTKTTSVAYVNISGVTQVRTVSSTNYANGKKRSTTDSAGNSNAYYYDAVGNLTAIVAPGSTSTMTYDAKGRYKVAMNDADMGSWAYEYDAFGQLRKQTDAKNVSSTFEYDKLGRKILAVEPEGHNLWIYDTAVGKGQGKLHKVIGPVSMTSEQVTAFLAAPATFDTSTLETASGFVQTVSYDDLGRAVKSTSKLDGSANDSDTAYFHNDVNGDPDFMNLDYIGRPARVLYPARDHDQKRVGLTYHYTKNSGGEVFLSSVQRHDYAWDGTSSKWIIVQPDPATVVWQLGVDGDFSNAVNKRGQITQIKLGNGLVTNRLFNHANGLLSHIGTGTALAPVAVQDVEYLFDSLGNLEQRKDYLLRDWFGNGNDLTEQFGYDIMNRLTEVKVSGIATAVQTLTYSADGNILTNSRLGTYIYDPSRPHAVTEVRDGQGNPLLGHTYTYDANGNMDSRGGNTVQYTSYNKPRLMGKDGNSVSIDYNANHSRYKKTVNMSEVTYYLPQLDKITSGGVTKYVHYMYAGDTLIGTHQVESTGARQTRYFHTDHLGSITVITNEFGTVVERRSYSAFGEAQPVNQTQNTDLSFSLSAGFSSTTVEGTDSTHGFGGHEMLDKVGLVHMNGRVYDPVLGRFLSADPNVQFPSSTQGMNRYAYVNNNPLSFTDPSGYFLSGLKKFMRKYGRTMVSMTILALAANPAFLAKATYAKVFAVAFSASVVASGDLKTAVIDGLAAMAFFKAGQTFKNAKTPYEWYEKATIHGVIGGITARAHHNSFKSGFVGSFVAKSVTIYGESAGLNDFQLGVATVIGGGIGAEWGGGKFKNGAFSAALGYLFNYYFSKSMPGASHAADGGLYDTGCQGGCHGTMPDGALTTYEDRKFVITLMLNGAVIVTGVGVEVQLIRLFGAEAAAFISFMSSAPSSDVVFPVAGVGNVTTRTSTSVIYRTGSQTEHSLTDLTGVSFRDSISSAANGKQTFRPGQNIYAVDTNKLPKGSVIHDGMPPGHVSVHATPQQIKDAIIPHGSSNPLDHFGLKRADNGSSYKLPK